MEYFLNAQAGYVAASRLRGRRIRRFPLSSLQVGGAVGGMKLPLLRWNEAVRSSSTLSSTEIRARKKLRARFSLMEEVRRITEAHATKASREIGIEMSEIKKP